MEWAIIKITFQVLLLAVEIRAGCISGAPALSLFATFSQKSTLFFRKFY